MKKRKIQRKQYQLIKNELEYFEGEGDLAPYQKDKMLKQYDVSAGLNFIRVLLTVGAFLLGIGVLSFVASNWMYIGKVMKLFLILSSIIGVNFAGFKMEFKHPKTARTMHYIGVMLYGAGIFLIGQAFNLGGEYENAFLVWALGIIPIGYVLKDKLILIFATFLLFGFGNISYLEMESIPYIFLVVIPILYFINKIVDYSRLFTFFINVLSIQFLVFVLLELIGFENNSFIIFALIMFGIGICMIFIPIQEKLKPVFKLQGHMIHATVGITLTFSYVWEESLLGGHFNIFFSIFYFLFILFLIKRGSLFSIAVLTALILRFYIDLSYDFLPKSIIFIVGGFILIGFGFYFEKQRKKGGERNEK